MFLHVLGRVYCRHGDKCGYRWITVYSKWSGLVNKIYISTGIYIKEHTVYEYSSKALKIK